MRDRVAKVVLGPNYSQTAFQDNLETEDMNDFMKHGARYSERFKKNLLCKKAIFKEKAEASHASLKRNPISEDFTVFDADLPRRQLAKSYFQSERKPKHYMKRNTNCTVERSIISTAFRTSSAKLGIDLRRSPSSHLVVGSSKKIKNIHLCKTKSRSFTRTRPISAISNSYRSKLCTGQTARKQGDQSRLFTLTVLETEETL